MEEKRTIQNALLAIQELGYEPDQVVITVISRGQGIKGFWYDEEILDVSDLEAEILNIMVGNNGCTITAQFL